MRCSGHSHRARFPSCDPEIIGTKPYFRNNPNTLRKKSAPGPASPRRPPQSGETKPDTPSQQGFPRPYAPVTKKLWTRGGIPGASARGRRRGAVWNSAKLAPGAPRLAFPAPGGQRARPRLSGASAAIGVHTEATQRQAGLWTQGCQLRKG